MPVPEDDKQNLEGFNHPNQKENYEFYRFLIPGRGLEPRTNTRTILFNFSTVCKVDWMTPEKKVSDV